MHFVKAQGTALQVGQAQGESLREPIRELLDRLFIEVTRVQGRDIDAVLRRLTPYAAHMERQLPHLAAEVHGVAQGAGITYLEAQLLNFQGEARMRRIDGCTSLAVTSFDRKRTVV